MLILVMMILRRKREKSLCVKESMLKEQQKDRSSEKTYENNQRKHRHQFLRHGGKYLQRSCSIRHKTNKRSLHSVQSDVRRYLKSSMGTQQFTNRVTSFHAFNHTFFVHGNAQSAEGFMSSHTRTLGSWVEYFARKNPATALLRFDVGSLRGRFLK